MKTKIILTLTLIALLTILAPSAEARQDTITLLTVGETEAGQVGGVAELHLEVKPGQGRIFMDSFPLSRVDTQISTRFAKDVACDFVDINCNNYDFFYTIRAGSSIVGGPSAGAAMTILTASVLEGHKVDDNIAITGTMNSGGVIGPVSGVEAKATAARDRGYEKVIIPRWAVSDEINNISTDRVDVEGIEIIEVGLLEEAILEFTGVDYTRDFSDITIPQEYQDIMSDVANDLCQRYGELETELQITGNETVQVNRSKENRQDAVESKINQDFYSAASQCFNANTALRNYALRNQTEEEQEALATEMEEEADRILRQLNAGEIQTVSDLETTMIVKERAFEVINILQDPTTRYDNMGYTLERLNSAVAWSRFFDYPGRPLNIQERHLEQACTAKIGEAEESINYLELLTGADQTSQREELDEVENLQQEGDHAFCIFRASSIKADANSALGGRALGASQVNDFIGDKLTAARGQINRQNRDFPILGYSYYNFAQNLQESRPDLALVFSEYALELGNLEMYFERESRNINFNPLRIPELSVPYFVSGILLGLSLSLAVFIGILKFQRRKIVRKIRKKKNR